MQNLGPQKGSLNRPSPDPSKDREGTNLDRSLDGTIPGTKKWKNRCLNPSSGTVNLICGVNISMAEAQEMEGVALVGKIRGQNPS